MQQRKQSKPVVSGGVDGMINAIHGRIHREAESRGEVWCEHRTHPSRKPGTSCVKCVRQTIHWESWVRVMGGHVVRGEWK